MAKQKSLSDDFLPDPGRYRKASEPHASPEAAEAALDAFLKDLSELRVKYQIRDLYLIYHAAMIENDGTETLATGVSGMGNPSLFESMTACAFGIEKSKREETIRRLLAGKSDKQ